MIYLKFPSVGRDEKIIGTTTVALDDIRSEAVLDARIGILGTATVENTEA